MDNTFESSVLGPAHESVSEEHPVDHTVCPPTPYGWRVEVHRASGIVDLAKTKLALLVSKAQRIGGIEGSISGDYLRLRLEKLPVLDASDLEYLLANPELIPQGWKGKAVYFWGTIYRNEDYIQVVRFIYWRDGKWNWSSRRLSEDWGLYDPAASWQADD